MTTVPFRSKRSAMETIAALSRDTHAPLTAMLEIADRCNEVCVHCYQIQGQKGEIETDDWRRILDELAEMGVLFLTISGGEATLRRDFLDIVAYARRKRFAVKIYTNGLTMTRELARRLADHAVQEVQISLYSHRAEVHDAVTRVPGSWKKTVDGARYLIEAGVAVVLKSPVMKMNAADVDAYVDFVSSLGADYMLDPQVDAREDGDRSPEALRVDDEEYLRLKRNPRISAAAGMDPGIRELDSSPCGACSGNVHIEANGEIRPCTSLGVPVGHALEDGVRQAYERNPEALTIRSLTWGDLHGCRECDLRHYCGRCYANARDEAGDALGPYPGACHRAKLEYELSHGVAPAIAAAPELGRDGSLGPYRRTSEHAFRCIEDVVTEEDHARYRRHPWMREPQRLVQIRRRGAKDENDSDVRPVGGARERVSGVGTH
ncbi:MAG TPA: radical SAM protein [Sandaracinaceae bacterium LLY-WYZ-13_1]|nr:radical SAM protein [Sandaracinaceae bacterium LLY-WYZ-13_1]